MHVPVIKEAFEDEIKTTAFAISSGVPNLFSGICSSIIAFINSGASFNFSSHLLFLKIIFPGAILLTLSLFPNLCDNDFIRVFIDDFATEYEFGAPRYSPPAIEEIKVKEPK
jgi:hypothetical protein